MRSLILAMYLAAFGAAVLPARDAAAAETKTRKPPLPQPKDERDLKMNAGTMQAGGSITLDIVSAAGANAFGFNLYPNIGYFAADRVEILAGVDLGLVQGSTTWGFDLGGRVFADLGDPWAYLGITGGYGSTSVSAAGVTGSAGIAKVTPMLGVVVPLAKNVGVDLGTRIDIGIAGGSTMIAVPIGFLGVDAYFK